MLRDSRKFPILDASPACQGWQRVFCDAKKCKSGGLLGFLSVGKDNVIMDKVCDSYLLVIIMVIIIEDELEISLRAGRKERLQLFGKR